MGVGSWSGHGSKGCVLGLGWWCGVSAGGWRYLRGSVSSAGCVRLRRVCRLGVISILVYLLWQEPERQGVAVSRLAEVLLYCIDQLKLERYKVLLDGRVLAKVLAAADKVRPSLAVLNGGRLQARDQWVAAEGVQLCVGGAIVGAGSGCMAGGT